LVEWQTRRAASIDSHVTHVITCNGGDEELQVSLADHIGSYRSLMNLSIGEDIYTRDQRYEGVDRLAKPRERLAEGIADGSSTYLHTRQPFSRQLREDERRDPPT
jgi:hypothetical protein